MKILLVIIVVIVLGILFVSMYIYKKRMKEQYMLLLHKLDAVLTGKQIDIMFDESLDSAISERLNRIVEISNIQRTNAEKETKVIKSLLSDINHQIKTPLSNVILYTGLLEEQLTDQKAIFLSRKINKNAEKLDFFMKELIKCSYTEQELITVNPQVIEVDTLIQRSCQLVELEALKKEIHIVTSYHGYTGQADSKWMEEVVGNIIENAIKYSPTKSTVSIDSILYESFVCIQVKDAGIGIPEEEQGRVFQRFYRGTNVKDKQGFGIGLYLAREIVTRQKGYIKLNSIENKGTIVSIFLLR